MYAGVIASVVGHVLLVVLLAVGLPELFPPEDKVISTNSVGVITEDQLAALSEVNLPPAREAGSRAANTAAVVSATDAKNSQQTAEAAQSADAQDATKSAANNAVLTAADASSSAAAKTANAALPPEATASAPRLPPRRPIESATASTAPPSLTPSQPQADAATRAPTELATFRPPPEASVTKPPELAAALPPELSTAKSLEAKPETPPENPDEPRPREVLVQTAVTRAEARRARLPPRRPAHLDDPPDEMPNTGARQLAEAPQKATSTKPTKQDFFVSMKSRIGATPAASGLDDMRKTLGVGIAGARVSTSVQAALARRLGGCWYKPDGQRNAHDLIVELSVELDPSSNLIGTPRVLKKPPASAGAPGRVAVERAIRTVSKCAPFNAKGLILRPNSYPNWRTMRITFDPS